jgi:hypothetical protein
LNFDFQDEMEVEENTFSNILKRSAAKKPKQVCSDDRWRFIFKILLTPGCATCYERFL